MISSVATETDLSGCRGALGGRVLVAVGVAVSLRLLTRRPTPSRLGSRRLKALAGAPSPSFGFSPFLLLSEEEKFPLSFSGGLGVVESPASSWWSGVASWSEEEVFLESVRHDIREGVAPVGRDHIAMQVAVAIRSCRDPVARRDKLLSRRAALSQQGCRGTLPCHDNLVVATRLPDVTFLSRLPYPSQWDRDGLGGRDKICAIRSGTGVCRSLTSWSVRGVGWFCLWALNLVEVRGGLACGETSFSRGCSVSLVVTPGCSFPTLWRSGMLVLVSWLAFQQGPSVTCRRALLLLLGTHASSVVASSLVLRLGSSSTCSSVWV
ncbi:hypothetical protein Taro_032610 [Colocasia esculenta]|uniref:Uncharacterized protein n=1 Tax=Colocasia esculenta TaxID=4460 RepID=A0A843VRS3_COLES|nr:hypothetical protein [Colocasia esculenta]